MYIDRYPFEMFIDRSVSIQNVYRSIEEHIECYRSIKIHFISKFSRTKLFLRARQPLHWKCKPFFMKPSWPICYTQPIRVFSRIHLTHSHYGAHLTPKSCYFWLWEFQENWILEYSIDHTSGILEMFPEKKRFSHSN